MNPVEWMKLILVELMVTVNPSVRVLDEEMLDPSMVNAGPRITAVCVPYFMATATFIAPTEVVVGESASTGHVYASTSTESGAPLLASHPKVDTAKTLWTPKPW